jgi:Uma2 family endonuclease
MMHQKLDEYFEARVRLVWYIDPRPRTASIYTARQPVTTIDCSGYLEGGDVLPEIKLRLGGLFERADRRQQPSS